MIQLFRLRYDKNTKFYILCYFLVVIILYRDIMLYRYLLWSHSNPYRLAIIEILLARDI